MTIPDDASIVSIAGARMVLELLSGKQPERDVLFSPYLIERTTTGSAPMLDPAV